jgi:uncharacterized protein (DUF2336 family)
MNAALNLLNQVDEAISSGSLSRRGELIRHVTDLFIVGADRCDDEDVALFDTVFTRLAGQIEQAARVLLAARLAPIPNAPPITIRALAFDDAIDVAGPVLAQSERLDETALIENASTKGQEHLLAISRRRSLSEAVTDVLVVRGDRQVVLSTAENPGAKFSENGFGKLVERAAGDDRLAECVGSRAEIPLHLFLALLEKASNAVRAKLEKAHPQAKSEVRRAVAEATDTVRDGVLDRIRDHATALAFVESLQRVGRLDDDRLQSFAQAGRLAEVVATLALMSGLSLSVVDRAMVEERPDTLIVMAKAIALSAATAKALLVLHAHSHSSTSAQAIEQSMASFERLSAKTAQEIVRFWRLRGQTTPPRRTH